MGSKKMSQVGFKFFEEDWRILFVNLLYFDMDQIFYCLFCLLKCKPATHKSIFTSLTLNWVHFPTVSPTLQLFIKKLF